MTKRVNMSAGKSCFIGVWNNRFRKKGPATARYFTIKNHMRANIIKEVNYTEEWNKFDIDKILSGLGI